MPILLHLCAFKQCINAGVEPLKEKLKKNSTLFSVLRCICDVERDTEENWRGVSRLVAGFTAVKNLRITFKQVSSNNLQEEEEEEERLTVKLLLTFLVLDSATLASVRSTSSKMIDCRETEQLSTEHLSIERLVALWTAPTQ